MSRLKWMIVLLLAPFLSFPVYAQDNDITIVRSITVSVKPGMNAQFEEFIRALRDASREQGLDNYWRASQSISGEPVYRFNGALSGGWGDLADTGPQLVEQYGELEAARLVGLLGESVASMHTAFYQQRASMSHLPASLDSPPEGINYIDFRLNPGGAAAYQELTTKTAEATAAAVPNAYFVGAMGGIGSTGPRTILIIQSFSDMDTPQPGPAQRVLQHFGPEEGARINALAAEAVESFQFTLHRTRPDLSYQPAD